MSRFFPHSPYAEDQPWSHTLLWSHVLYRGFQTGATLGMATAGLQSVYQIIKKTPAHSRASFSTTLLRNAGIGSLTFMALMVPGMLFRMQGKEEIEWRDRSWRLLESEGQKGVDDWSLVGTVVGGAAVVRQSAVKEVGTARVYRIAGGASVGSMAGVVGFMIWRYGAHGGKR